MLDWSMANRELGMQLELETERLLLRPLQQDDLDLAIALWSDPEVTRYVAERTYSVEEIAEEMPITVRRAAKGAVGIWCVLRKTDGQQLGSCFLLPMPIEEDDTDWSRVQGDDLPSGRIELGYTYIPTAWGHGYATEASRRLVRFAFEESPIQELYAAAESENAASMRVLIKSGFTPIGQLRAYGEDLPGFKLTAEEWRKANG